MLYGVGRGGWELLEHFDLFDQVTSPSLILALVVYSVWASSFGLEERAVLMAIVYLKPAYTTSMTEKSLNLTKLHGEQDPENKIPYAKWARQIKNFIECKGTGGSDLLKAMEWAQKQSRTQPITDDMVRENFPDVICNGWMKQLKLLIENWTGGKANSLVRYNVKNALGAWRKLHHSQLPEAEHRNTDALERV